MSSALPHIAVARPEAHIRQPWRVRGALSVPRAFVLFGSPQSKRHCCAPITTTVHSGGGLNGTPEGGAIVAEGDIDTEADGDADGDDGEGSIVAVATGTDVHAVSRDSTPAATHPRPRMTSR